MKKIFIYDLHNQQHTSLELMIHNSPEGYEFILPQEKLKQNMLKFFTTSKILKFFYQTLSKIPSLKLMLYKKFNFPKIPEDINLIFSPGILLNENFGKPWILEILDNPSCVTGNNYKLFKKDNASIGKKLLSPYCKKIIVVNESSLRIMKKYFNKKVLKKCELVRAAVKEQNFTKNYNKKNLQMLFMGSMGNPDDFYIKGGIEAMESFSKIAKKFPSVRLIVRCKIPKGIKQKYSKIKNIEIIEHPLNSEEWDNLKKNTDISLQPGHLYPLMGTLEPMSYGIPLIMLDTYAVRDYVTEKNAILIEPSDKITGYKSEDYPLNVRSKKFISEIKNLDSRVIRDISQALEKLISDWKLRQKMGLQARKIIKDKFSIERRNKKLKNIFNNI